MATDLGHGIDASDIGTIHALSPLSVSFAELRNRVLSIWLARIKQEIPAARILDESILVNIVPVLYDDIAESLTPEYPRAYATSGTNLAYAHGRDRANLTAYQPSDVVYEFQLLHDVIVETLDARGIMMETGERSIIDKSIHFAIRESVAAFTSTALNIGQMFMASLSHDVRNPLSVVNSCAQLIRLKTDNADIISLTKKMVGQITEVDAMLRTLLDATMFAGGHKLKLDISELDMRSLAEESCVDMPAETDRYVVSGDAILGFWCRVAMKRALQNLLSNAQKYGAPGTRIDVRVTRVDHRVFISVHNEGPAIPHVDIERMFSAFQRLGGLEVQGWGLGLPFVRNVAESHCGTVFVDSAAERGTTFTISLPVDCRQA